MHEEENNTTCKKGKNYGAWVGVGAPFIVILGFFKV
jgi:hypothetical protein